MISKEENESKSRKTSSKAQKDGNMKETTWFLMNTMRAVEANAHNSQHL